MRSVLFLLLAAATPLTAFDFTLHSREIPLGEGAVIRRTYFKDGDRCYAFHPGESVDLAAEAERATFRFRNLHGATLLLTQSPFTPEKAFTQENLPSYRESALKHAPAGVLEIIDESDEEGVLRINDWHSHRWVFTYKLPGQTIRQSVTFLNLTPKRQIVVVVTAFASEFKEAEAAALGILHSWHPMEAAELMKPLDS